MPMRRLPAAAAVLGVLVPSLLALPAGPADAEPAVGVDVCLVVRVPVLGGGAVSVVIGVGGVHRSPPGCIPPPRPPSPSPPPPPPPTSPPAPSPGPPVTPPPVVPPPAPRPASPGPPRPPVGQPAVPATVPPAPATATSAATASPPPAPPVRHRKTRAVSAPAGATGELSTVVKRRWALTLLVLVIGAGAAARRLGRHR
jgi:hypothetical protein